MALQMWLRAVKRDLRISLAVPRCGGDVWGDGKGGGVWGCVS